MLAPGKRRVLLVDNRCPRCGASLLRPFNPYDAESRYCGTCDEYWEIATHDSELLEHSRGEGCPYHLPEQALEPEPPRTYYDRPCPTCPYCGHELHHWPAGNVSHGQRIAVTCLACKGTYEVQVRTVYTSRPKKSNDDPTRTDQ